MVKWLDKITVNNNDSNENNNESNNNNNNNKQKGKSTGKSKHHRKISLKDNEKIYSKIAENDQTIETLMNEISMKEQKNFYVFYHSNYFWRRTFALAFALPWETCLDLWLENEFEKESQIWIKILVTICNVYIT